MGIYILKLGYEINGFLKNYSFSEIILNHELLLMEQLNFHITVHNPWRPVEGLIIDIKTRLLPDLPVRMDVEKFRSEIEKFLDEAVAQTNASLIYAPSQVQL